MDDATLNRFEAMLAGGQDNPLMRLSLGQEYVNRNDGERARAHLQRALELDPNYTAAWKWLGKAYESLGQRHQAREAFERGVEIARVKGDKQLERELGVFLKRLGDA